MEEEFHIFGSLLTMESSPWLFFCWCLPERKVMGDV